MGSSQEGEEGEEKKSLCFFTLLFRKSQSAQEEDEGDSPKKMKQASISDKKTLPRIPKGYFFVFVLKNVFVVSNPVLYLPVFSLPSPVSPSPHGAFPPPLLFYAISFPPPTSVSGKEKAAF